MKLLPDTIINRWLPARGEGITQAEAGETRDFQSRSQQRVERPEWHWVQVPGEGGRGAGPRALQDPSTASARPLLAPQPHRGNTGRVQVMAPSPGISLSPPC